MFSPIYHNLTGYQIWDMKNPQHNWHMKMSFPEEIIQLGKKK